MSDTAFGHLIIPTTLLPTPRLVIWHGDIESADDQRPLDVLHRAYHAAVDHGFIKHSVSAGGSDWSAWHIPDTEALAGMATVARAIGPSHWKIIEE